MTSYRIAVVEDAAFDQKLLLEYLQHYQEKEKVSFQIDIFEDGAELISDYPKGLDILLADIAMERLDGMKMARLVRRKDERVVIIFVSNMIHYCIQGYSVEALDFIVKPVTYMGLKIRLDRALSKLNKNTSRKIQVRSTDGILQIDIADICFVETFQHKIMIHTKEHSFPVNVSMRTLESQLQGLPFFRCHNSFLIHLKYVDKIQGNDIWVNNQLLSISRYRRKEFLEAWAVYIGEGE